MDFIDGAERRRRLAVRHHLTCQTDSVLRVAGDLVGLHSSDPATVFLSARARATVTVEMLERELYERRTLVRMHGVRRTMFVVPVAMAPLLEAGAARAYLPGQINRIARLAEADGVARDGVAWVRDLMDAAANGLEGRGPTSASELTALVPDLATKLAMGRGTVGMTSRVLYLLGAAGRVVRGRPRGSWIASQYAWSLTEDWFDGRWDDATGPEAARADLLGRWLGAYGPGSMVDLRWWTGWSKAHVTSALETVGAVEVQLDDGTGFVVNGDEGTTPDPGPWAAFLPGLDPTPMGWKEREWFSASFPGPHYDRNGNIGPTIWCNGRAVGAWATGADGHVRIRMDDDSADGDADRDLIETERLALENWLDGTQVTPRFRTPIEREISR